MRCCIPLNLDERATTNKGATIGTTPSPRSLQRKVPAHGIGIARARRTRGSETGGVPTSNGRGPDIGTMCVASI